MADELATAKMLQTVESGAGLVEFFVEKLVIVGAPTPEHDRASKRSEKGEEAQNFLHGEPPCPASRTLPV